MRRIFIALLIFALSFVSYSQSNCKNSLFGKVVDLKTGEVLPFANIQIQDTNKGTISDLYGSFFFENICEDEIELVVSYLGYKSTTHHHDVHHSNPTILLAPENYNLESVVVEEEVIRAGEIGQSSSILKLEDVGNNMGSLADVMSELAGVDIVKTGQNVTKPVIHGLHSNRVLIMNDDLKHEFQNWGADHAPEIDPDQFESIEVIKGAATVKYGPDALGGVILLKPKKMTLHEDFNGIIKSASFTNGRGASLGGQFHGGSHKLAATGGFNGLLQGDLASPDYILSNTGKKEWSINAGVRYHLPKFDIELSGAFFHQELGILRGSNTGSLVDLVEAIDRDVPLFTSDFGYEIISPKQVTDHRTIKLNSKYYLANSWLEFKYGLQLNDRFEFDVRRGTNNETPSIDLTLLSQNIQFEYNHAEVLNWTGNIGLSAVFQDNNNNPGTNTVPFVPNYNTSKLGFFVIENRSIGKANYEFGIRYDWQTSSIRGRDNNNDLFFDQISFANLSASFGGEFLLGSKYTFRSNLGSAWRPPNISELYSFGRHQSSIEYGFWRYNESSNVNPTSMVLTQDDKPVRSEIGWKWINSISFSNSNVDWSLSVYANYIQNYIYSSPKGITNTVRGAFPFWVYQQDDALFTGFDFSVLMRHGSFTSQFSMAYVDARNLSQQFFVGIPPGSARYTIGRKISFKKGTLGLSLSPRVILKQYNAPPVIQVSELLELYQNEQQQQLEAFGVFDILDPPPTYFLLDAEIVYANNKWTASLKSYNSLNTSYRNYTDRLRYFADDTGINVQLSLNYKIKAKKNL